MQRERPQAAAKRKVQVVEPQLQGRSDDQHKCKAEGKQGAARQGAEGASFKRPTTMRALKRADEGSLARLEREVVGGRLWFSGCQRLNRELPEVAPVSFASPEEYIGTFEPLLFEEAREEIRSSWVEAADFGYGAEVLGVQELGGGWHSVKLQAQLPGSEEHWPREGGIVVLSSARPRRNTALDLARLMEQAAARQPNGSARAGASDANQTLPKASGAAADVEEGEIAVADGDADAGRRASHRRAGPRHRRDADRNSGSDTGGGTGRDSGDRWEAVMAGIVREVKRTGEVTLSLFPPCAAHLQDDTACCRQVVQRLRERPKGWTLVNAGNLITQLREFAALHKLRQSQVLEYILRPERLAEEGERLLDLATIQRMWPPEVAQREFIDFLKRQYDHTQLQAIEVAACHLGGREAETLPFVLIQGPPGTGKTHTVKGILNVWHLVHFQRYYSSLTAQLQPPADDNPRLAQEMRAKAQSAMERRLPGLAAKPRILICTPSNAAADELLQRIMDAGFSDGAGAIYRPSVVRIGSTEAPMTPRARDVWVDGLIKAYLEMDPQLFAQRYQASQAQAVQLSREISALQAALQAAGGREEADAMARHLATKHEARDKAILQLQRLHEAEGAVMRRPGFQWKAARENLEVSFVSEAEMVFTTLSCTGRRVFERLQDRFETVLIDEAAQASEVAALQALTLGCRRVVLVGDPQQLPATVKSRLAQAAQLERSLFERIQLVAPRCVKLLSVQYRMHPSIRQFPSDHFYAGSLEDGDSVVNAPPEPFYESPLLKPYVFFDVSAGREARGAAFGGSMGNQAEANLAACLFHELRSFLIAAAKEGRPVGRVTVGVITPYRQQRRILKQTFQAIAGKEAADEVMIETVDSFQGKQLDVVILSCVRAGSPGARGGIGFVADVRRMNVAITRAKRALWVLGSAATLAASPEWAALMRDAEERGVVIRNAKAEELFPHHTIPSDLQQQQQEHGGRGTKRGRHDFAGMPHHPGRGHHRDLDGQMNRLPILQGLPSEPPPVGGELLDELPQHGHDPQKQPQQPQAQWQQQVALADPRLAVLTAAAPHLARSGPEVGAMAGNIKPPQYTFSQRR